MQRVSKSTLGNAKKGSMLPVAIIFGLAGVIPLGIGLYVYDQQTRFVAEALEAQGEVVEIFLASTKASTGGSDLKSYAPRVVFHTKSGEKVDFRASASSSDPGYTVGDKLSLLYDPETPSDAVINNFFHLWLLPILMMGLGGIFTLLAALLIFLDIRERIAARKGIVPHSRMNSH